MDTKYDGQEIVERLDVKEGDHVRSGLFGYEKGAFTGALNRRAGKFESAQSGTIFLDEIGELSLAVQPKLLRVLQEHTFERVGDARSIRADFRVIAATNRSLDEEVATGRFRSDLYFRLSVVPIALPTLRDRRADVVLLAEHFLQHFSGRHGMRATGFAEESILKLQRYAFPGNVRELGHIVERATLRAGGRAITPDLIVVEDSSMQEGPKPNDLERLLELPYHESVQAWERLLIERAMKLADGNKAEAARILGIHRRRLYEKLPDRNADSLDPRIDS